LKEISTKSSAKGWIVSGFPQNRIQALQLQQLAQYPDHVFVLETNTSNVDALDQKYDANIKDVLACFEGIVTFVNADVHVGKVYSVVKSKLDGMPNNLKVVVLGATGSGKTTQCERITTTFNVVRVNLDELPYNIVNEPKNVPTDLLEGAQAFVKSGNATPQFLFDILKWRLNQTDCLERGWVVDDFPVTAYEVSVFVQEGIFPDYVIVLDGLSEQVAKERIEGSLFEYIILIKLGRRINSENHHVYHTIFNPPPNTVQVVKIPKDSSAQATIPKKIRSYNDNIKAIVEEFGKSVTKVDAKLPISVVSAQVISTLRGEKYNSKIHSTQFLIFSSKIYRVRIFTNRT
jgi:adenylate kinase family enzyme